MTAQYTVLRRAAGKPAGDEDLVYRGASLDLAKEHALGAVRWPEVPQAIIYADRLEDDGHFTFTGESWGWAEAGSLGKAVRSVTEQAAIAARELEDDLHRRRRALLRHVTDHAGAAFTLGGALLDIDVGIAIAALERVHRELHPGAADPYHEVR